MIEVVGEAELGRVVRWRCRRRATVLAHLEDRPLHGFKNIILRFDLASKHPVVLLRLHLVRLVRLELQAASRLSLHAACVLEWLADVQFVVV